MIETGIENCYVMKNHKRLRCGYTTGSCAAAAAKAAALMLFSRAVVHEIPLMTPKGILLKLEVLEASIRENQVSCAVRKDGGDDPDATNGILVFASVSRREAACRADLADDAGKGGDQRPGPADDAGKGGDQRPDLTDDAGKNGDQRPDILIDGGIGVGRVTKKGLQVPVGEAAINPVPRRMIREAVEEVCADFEYSGGLYVEISIPQGAEIAKKTFNPRLGIEGGISVLGTSGIVVPMSEEALIASIRVEMEMLAANGHEYLIITPGNYGETFTKNEMTVDLSASMKCSNYVGETLDIAAELGVKGILFVAHVGKFIKVAGGIMNTHSRQADARAELMAAFALRAGADRETACRILDTITTDEALDIMEQQGIRQKAMDLAAERIHEYLQHRVNGALETEAIIFSSSCGYLAQTRGADDMLKRFAVTEENVQRSGRIEGK